MSDEKVKQHKIDLAIETLDANGFAGAASLVGELAVERDQLYARVAELEQRLAVEEAHGEKYRAALAKREAADVLAALTVISEAMKADHDYAWTWHCNVAMTAQDAGAPHDRANVWAAEFMKRAFNVDTLARVNAELLAASQQAKEEGQ